MKSFPLTIFFILSLLYGLWVSIHTLYYINGEAKFIDIFIP